MTSSNRTESGSLRITVRGHWVNRWWLVAFTRPYVRVDGHEHQVAWGREQTLPLSVGAHSLETFIRYRGIRADLGAGRLDFTVTPGQEVCVEAINGVTNGTPFTPRMLPRS